MNFEFTEEQLALRDSMARLLGRHYGFEQRRRMAAGESGGASAVWRQLAELGVTGLLVPEDCGGFGGGMQDMLAVLPEAGRALALEPLLSSAVLGATALRLADVSEPRRQLLAGIADGSRQVAWCHGEAPARHARTWVQARAEAAGGGWKLYGSKCNVLHGASAHAWIVSARISGQAADRGGLGLFLVLPGSAGITVSGYRLMDDTPAADVELDGAQALALCVQPQRAADIIERTQAAGMAAVCADSLGALELAYQLAAAYMHARRQFGRLIGENQALRHKAAEMLVSLEMCRSMAMAAAVAADQPDSLDLQRAKIVVGRQGRSVCHAAIQIHGGIGMTEEYAVGHCLRRVVVQDQLFGDADAHIGRLAESLLAA